MARKHLALRHTLLWMGTAGLLSLCASEKKEIPMHSEKSLTQARLDKAAAWKKYKSLFAAAEKENSPDKLDAVADQSHRLEPELAALLADSSLAVDLARLLAEYAGFRKEACRPRRGRRPRPDYGRETALSYRYFRVKFRIVEAFRALGAEDSLMASFAAQLPADMENLKASLQSAEAWPGGPEKAGPEAPGALRPAHAGPADKAAKLREIKTFVETVRDSLAAWKKGKR